jgi:Lrp/AsnC family transcriptional regulator, regulator for asnA, asnC and gidA
MKISCLDRKIIRCLSEDARMPLARVAEILDVPDSTVRHRLSRLTEAGVVTFVTLTDPLKVGYKFWVMIGLKVDLAEIENASRLLAEFPEVYFVAATTGGFDIILNAVFTSNEDLFRFVSEKLSRVAGIKDTMTFHYLSIPKRQMVILPPSAQPASE